MKCIFAIFLLMASIAQAEDESYKSARDINISTVELRSMLGYNVWEFSSPESNIEKYQIGLFAGSDYVNVAIIRPDENTSNAVKVAFRYDFRNDFGEFGAISGDKKFNHQFQKPEHAVRYGKSSTAENMYINPGEVQKLITFYPEDSEGRLLYFGVIAVEKSSK